MDYRSQLQALLSANSNEEALRALDGAPEMLGLNFDLALWDQQSSQGGYQQKQLYTAMRQTLRAVRSFAPRPLLAQGERAGRGKSGGIVLPRSLVEDFAPVGVVQSNPAAASVADFDRANTAIDRMLDRVSGRDEAAVRAVLLMMRAEIIRPRLLSSDFTAISRISADYARAAESYDEENFPHWRAEALNKLGNHLQTHPCGDPIASLQGALDAHKEALRLFTELEDVAERGNLLQNLGNDYVKLHDFTGQYREEAIQSYREALKLRTREKGVRSFADSSHGLGRALLLPLSGSSLDGGPEGGQSVFDETISTLQSGIDALGSSDRSPLFAALHHDLGIAYAQRVRLLGDSGIETLTKSIRSFKLALEIWKQLSNRAEVASTSNALGVTYLMLPLESPNTLREAERCFREALGYRRPDRGPDQYGDSMDNLGLALLRGASNEAQLRDALNCFTKALEVSPKDTRPKNFARTTAHVGNVYEALAKLGVPDSKLRAAENFETAAAILEQQGGGNRESIIERLRRLPSDGHVW